MSTVIRPRFRDRRRRVVNLVMLGLTGVAAVVTVIPLLLIFFYLLEAGLSSLNPAFFTEVPAPVGETGGGIGNSILGTFELVLLAALMHATWSALAYRFSDQAAGFTMLESGLVRAKNTAEIPVRIMQMTYARTTTRVV